MVGFCLAEKDFRKKVEECVTEETANGKCYHDREGGGIDVGRAKSEQEICVTVVRQCCRRKIDPGSDVLGGPEIYSVPSSALTAGLPGNKMEKILDVRLDVGGLVAALWALRLTTRGHCCPELSFVYSQWIEEAMLTKTASSSSAPLICAISAMEKLPSAFASAEIWWMKKHIKTIHMGWSHGFKLDRAIAARRERCYGDVV